MSCASSPIRPGAAAPPVLAPGGQSGLRGGGGRQGRSEGLGRRRRRACRAARQPCHQPPAAHLRAPTRLTTGSRWRRRRRAENSSGPGRPGWSLQPNRTAAGRRARRRRPAGAQQQRGRRRRKPWRKPGAPPGGWHAAGAPWRAVQAAGCREGGANVGEAVTRGDRRKALGSRPSWGWPSRMPSMVHADKASGAGPEPWENQQCRISTWCLRVPLFPPPPSPITRNTPWRSCSGGVYAG